MRIKKSFPLLVLLLIAGLASIVPVSAEKPMKELEVHEQFEGITGTTVIKNLQTNQVYVYNEARSQKRFTPESTFKIANALIGLQTEAVRDEYDVKRWDGVEKEFEEWNRDHTLGSGMRHSVIWYYQAMARDIGYEKMKDYVDQLNFGNEDISGGINQFWLDSSLKISAQEQVQFIENLVEETLPLEEQHMRTVKRIMINKEFDTYTIHGKTGTRLSDLGLGWFVGYIETDKGVWVFATNINGSGSKAKTITHNILEEMNIIKE